MFTKSKKRQLRAVALTALLIMSIVPAGVVASPTTLDDGTASIEADSAGGSPSATINISAETVSNLNLNTSTAQETNGTVYVGSVDSSLYAIDAATGEKEWSYVTGHEIRSSPTVVDGTVYVGSIDNSVYAIDAATGEKEWSYATGNDVYSSPTVVNGTVYIGSNNDSLHAVDAATGEKEWKYATGGRVRSSPTVVDGTVYVGSTDNSVYAVDAATGEKEWKYATGRNVYSSPTVVDGTVYVGSTDNSLYAVDAATGEKEWSYATGDTIYSSPTVANGTVYVGSYDNSLYAIDAATGGKEWRYATGRDVRSSPTVVNGTVYVGSNNDSLHAVDAATGEKEWKYAAGNYVYSSPTFISAGSSESDGSRVLQRTLGHHTGSHTTDEADLSGQVTREDGTPVKNATVRVVGVDYDNIVPSYPGQTDGERANEIIDNDTDLTPSAWDENFDVVSERFEGGIPDDTKIVAVHSSSDWAGEEGLAIPGTGIQTQDPQLDEPTVNPAGDEAVYLSLWERAPGVLNIQDNADEDLTGRTTSGAIVIEQLGPDSITTDSYTVDTTEQVTLGTRVGEKTHEAARTNLNLGYYRVHPEGAPETSYVIQVGESDAIRSHYIDQLRDESGNLHDRANQIQERFEQGVYEEHVVTTNETGHYSVDLRSTTKTVAVTAVKAGDIDLQDPDLNPMAVARDVQSNGNYNSSFLVTGGVQRYDTPTNNADITVRERELLPYTPLDVGLGLRDFFNERLRDRALGLHGQARQQVNQTEEELRISLEDLGLIVRDNRKIRETAEEYCNCNIYDGDGDIINDSLSREELRERVDSIEETLEETRDSIDSGTGSNVGNETISAWSIFDGEVTEDDVTVRVHYSNGTSRPVSGSYITIDKSAGTSVGGGQTNVSVVDLPLGNATSAQLEWVVVREDGTATSEEIVNNPLVNANPPGIDSIRLTTLEPSPNERITVEMNPSADSPFRELTDATVYAPNGSTLPTENIIDGDTTRFETIDAGLYTLQLTYTDIDGNEYVKTVRVQALASDQPRTPSIRAESGPTGVFAVVGDGLINGDIDFATNEDLRIAAVAPEGDVPTELHAYTSGVDTHPSGDINVRVLEGEQRRSIDQRLMVYVHTRSMPADNTYVYRSGKLPVTQDGNQYGSVTHQSNQTLIALVTDEQGTVTATVKQPTGFIDKNIESFLFTIRQYEIFGVRVPVSLAPTAGGFGIIGIGLFVRRRRGDAL